jgi:xanthine dehydrogenase accessory factor
MKDNIYKNLMSELNEGKQAVIITYLNKSKPEKKLNKILLAKEKMDNQSTVGLLGENLYNVAQEVFENGKIRWYNENEVETVLIEPFYPQPKLIILGGGHIATPLVEFGSRLGFDITVIDDRPTFANTERFPGAKQVICDSFENSFNKIKLNRSCFVVIVTRGHRHDLVCLNNVLKYDNAYVGMIGSKRRVRIVRENLLENGFTKEQLEKLNSPIGLPIGAVTPEEIAISILGQVIAARRLGKTTLDDSTKSSKGKWLEFDVDVIEELEKESQEPKAVVTIISTKGSSPRHAGAKMIVWPHGKILGSIGGGCCEAEVITIARDIMNEGGGYRTHTVDMTNEAAEEEGMVCGGTMEVLIEA